MESVDWPSRPLSDLAECKCTSDFSSETLRSSGNLKLCEGHVQMAMNKSRPFQKKEQSVLLLTTQIPFENFKDSNDDPFWQWEDTPREFNSDGRTENCSCFECIAMVKHLL